MRSPRCRNGRFTSASSHRLSASPTRWHTAWLSSTTTTASRLSPPRASTTARNESSALPATTASALALSIWVTATAVGLSAVLRASGELLFVLKLVGAAYLAYLGVRALLDSRQRPADLLAATPPPAPAHAIFRQGFLSALS